VAPPSLVWYAEKWDGTPVASNQAEVPINPASVVKVATSLWALERLGPDFRFDTRIFARGRLDHGTGTLQGDLVVQGTGDPDFQVDNAFLVAAALDQMGISRVTGALVVNRTFWIGSENGSQGTLADPTLRGLRMAGRLREALDPRRWSASMRTSWRAFARRRGVDVRRPPRVAVAGGVGVDGETRQGNLLLVHRSEPLRDLLRRFNCYSDNDIERLGTTLGAPAQLADLIAERCAVPRESIDLETTSGLGTNRVSPQAIVRLLRELDRTCSRLGLDASTILPLAGCEASTVSRFFPVLSSGEGAGAVVAKTGTLTSTDGGVSVLAGIASTAEGNVFFCVAVPRSGGRLHAARRAEERWLLDLLARAGGGVSHSCPGELPASDNEATVVVVGSQDELTADTLPGAGAGN
jgi:D-alanyl-D-alanine carboxypeptidase/D-alanyl-D-alanine-endopeptidase (penicillin-binding protein 4)